MEKIYRRSIFLCILLVLLNLTFCSDDSDFGEGFDVDGGEGSSENIDEENDVEYVPDEVDDDNDLDLENEAELAVNDIVQVKVIGPGANPKTYEASSGAKWSDEMPNIQELNEFSFDEIELNPTDIELTELDIFNSIFTDNILNK